MRCFKLTPSRLLIAIDDRPVVSLVFKNTPIDSGVYAIRCRYNGRTYVGSSKNIKRRWLRHRGDLRGGIHHSPHLQRAWDKYGEQGFEFFVLSYCAVDELLEHEQFWLDSSTCFYNGSRTAGRVDHTPETRARFGEKVRAAHQRPEDKAKMRLLRTVQILGWLAILLAWTSWISKQSYSIEKHEDKRSNKALQTIGAKARLSLNADVRSKE